MKRTIFALATVLVVFAAVFAVLALRPVTKVKAGNHACSPATLKGNYGLTALGADFDGYDVSFSMIATFDGIGGLTGSELNLFYAFYSAAYTDVSFTGGSYTVNPDCSVSLTIPPSIGPFTSAITLNGTLVDTGGDEVAGVWSADEGGGTSGTFDAKRIAQGQWKF